MPHLSAWWGCLIYHCARGALFLPSWCGSVRGRVPSVVVMPQRGCCCLLPAWWLEKGTQSGCWQSTLGMGAQVWQQPTVSSPVPGCRTVMSNVVCTRRVGESSQSSGFTLPLAFSGSPAPLYPQRRSIYPLSFMFIRCHVSFKSGLWGYSCLVTCYIYTPKAWL